MAYTIHICGIPQGHYIIKRGKQSIVFEESAHDGPFNFKPRTGDVTPISDTHPWFWKFYNSWREAGRPTEGQALSNDWVTIQNAKYVGEE
jgi:hypothetical protein